MSKRSSLATHHQHTSASSVLLAFIDPCSTRRLYALLAKIGWDSKILNCTFSKKSVLAPLSQASYRGRCEWFPGSQPGNGEGGGLFLDAGASATLSNSTVDHNQAPSGDGTNGGNGFGGGVYVATGATVSVTGSSIDHNRADGGDADDGGSDGLGIGGGVYNLGTFTFDVATMIAHNKASTSNDDTFGV